MTYLQVIKSEVLYEKSRTRPSNLAMHFRMHTRMVQIEFEYVRRSTKTKYIWHADNDF